MSLPDLLTTTDVSARYSCDPRAARAVMRAAGCFTAAGRLLVRADALDQWERDQATPRDACCSEKATQAVNDNRPVESVLLEGGQ
jgi:hypothetical protein